MCEEQDVNWKRAEIITNNQTQKNNQIVISWKCSSHKIQGVRYLWAESPCAYQKCPVYSKDGYLPMPPFMFRGELKPERMTPNSNDFISKITLFNKGTWYHRTSKNVVLFCNDWIHSGSLIVSAITLFPVFGLTIYFTCSFVSCVYLFHWCCLSLIVCESYTISVFW